MIKNAIRPIAVLATAAIVSAFAAGCGKSVQARTGFIPDSVSLREMNELTREWRGKLNASQIASITVLPPVTPNTGAYGDLGEDKLAKVREILATALNTELTPLARGGTGKTLVVHAAITAIKPNNPLLNIAPQTQILKRGYGYASCEIYATDGQGGPVVAAFMQTSDTQRLSSEKLSDVGTAERASGDWAKEFAKLLSR